MNDTTARSDFDLEVTVVEHGPVIPALLNGSEDNCGKTCESACANSTCN